MHNIYALLNKLREWGTIQYLIWLITYHFSKSCSISPLPPNYLPYKMQLNELD